jgi:hypothetical protein
MPNQDGLSDHAENRCVTTYFVDPEWARAELDHRDMIVCPASAPMRQI